MTSRVRARISMAANSVPTDANPIVPSTSSADEQQRPGEQRGPEQKGDRGNQQQFGRRHQHDHSEQFADVDSRARGGRQQERPKRLGVPLALERAPERQRPGKRNRDPQNPRGGARNRLALFHERDRENHHARDREEERRVQNLPAPHLDGEVLLQHEQRGSQEHRLRSGPCSSASGTPDAERPTRNGTRRSRQRAPLHRVPTCFTRCRPARDNGRGDRRRHARRRRGGRCESPPRG